MPIPSRSRSDRGQMDGADHPIAVEADNALRRAPARDRRNLAKDVDPNASQPGAGRSGRSQGLSSRSTESRIFAFQTGPDVDRAVARTLPVVGETSGRASSQSRARKGETQRRERLIPA